MKSYVALPESADLHNSGNDALRSLIEDKYLECEYLLVHPLTAVTNLNIGLLLVILIVQECEHGG